MELVFYYFTLNVKAICGCSMDQLNFLFLSLSLAAVYLPLSSIIYFRQHLAATVMLKQWSDASQRKRLYCLVFGYGTYLSGQLLCSLSMPLLSPAMEGLPEEKPAVRDYSLS